MANNTVNINAQNDTVTVEKDASANSVSVTNSNTIVNVTAPSNTVTLDGATSANTVTINSQNDIIKLLSITEPKGDTVTITEPESKVVTVTTPGPPGPPLASITETDSLVSFDRDISVTENLFVNQHIMHKDDDNTYINFTDDRIRFNAGGLNLFGMHKKGSTPHQVTVNNGSNNVDFVVKDNSNNKLIQTDASARGIIIDGSKVDFTNLPTTDPGVAGRLWKDSNTLKISAG